MKKAFIIVCLAALLVASGGSGIYFATNKGSLAGQKVYLPYISNSGVPSLLIRGYVADQTIPSGSPPALPNLLPYAPINWSYPVVPAGSRDTLQIGPLVAGQASYFNWAILNEGNTMAHGRIYTCLYLDGVLIGRWYGDDQPKHSYAFVTNWQFPLLSGGSHTVKIQADCTGVIVEANESDNTWQMAFSWQLPILVSGQQGFDACTAPSLAQMQTWWQHSPYYDINIYIGGISRGCGQPDLSASWVQSVNSMGWRLIPTWVGPQAPCSYLRNKMSSNPSTAYNQGRSEANSASAAAAQLGLVIPGQAGTVLYYDMEAFTVTDLACLQAVQSFINGWVARLHELGSRAGVYSTPGALSKFASLATLPDDIWAAYWKTPYYYNPAATVWDLPYISNSQWANHQRIRQYTGGHNESWGGVTINIDSNVLDGHVAGTIPDPPAGAPGAKPAVVTDLGPQIQRLDLLAPGQGWALIGNSLAWTSDFGASWQDIGPRLAPGENLAAAHFLTPQKGWVVASMPPNPEGQAAWNVYATEDGGTNWNSSVLSSGATPGDAWSGGASLHFLDAQHGWLMLQQAGSSSFRLGSLFRTIDGGLTWQEGSIPIGEPVVFLTPDVGFTAGGANGDQVYRTTDGGLSWESQGIVPDLADGEIARYSLPARQDERSAHLSVFIQSEIQPRLERYQTRDSGQSWERLSTQPWQEEQLAASWPTGSHAQMLSSQQAAGLALPDGTFWVDFADPLNGWALSNPGTCMGQKGSEPLQCVLQTRMWNTRDGGASWIEVALLLK